MRLLTATLILCVSGLLPSAGSCQDCGPAPLIPRPNELHLRGGWMRLSIGSPVVVTAETREVGQYLAAFLERASGSVIEVRESSAGRGDYAPWDVDADIGAVVLSLDPQLERLGPEGYRMSIDSNTVRISAATADGVFYGCQSLRQLLPATAETGRVRDAAWTVPQMTVEDSPRFRWRGLMVDCSRTFQSVEYLHKLIDLLALYKMNVLHLHLTDDQGWRLQITRYPELTGRGATYPERYHQSGGFYTQAQMRELIKYARMRRVTIVPEIEMPGHCMGALAAYPQLSCTGGPFEIFPFFKEDGIQTDVFCAGNDSVFTFLQNVLDEVIGLFPSPYIHVGGDEVRKTRWEHCPKCQARMRKEGLKNEEELQSWFIRRVEGYMNAKGRLLLGWDEILQGGLAPRAAVMSWRGTEGGIKASGMGHDVVMSPTSHCYLDYEHTTISVEKAYSFDPAPEGFTDQQKQHVLGVQGNIWTHIAVSEPAVDRQVFPRLIALAEVGWTRPGLKDWNGFSARLGRHLHRLDELGVNYYRGE